MIGKKINQLATELAPDSTDLTIIGDPISGVSKKITLAQLGAIFSGAVAFYTNLAAFPVTGDINVIYCAKDTQKLYLWSGSAYVEVFPSQALLDTYQLRSEKGVSNGYASLDSAGKVPISQLPSSIMEYKGTWNASTNTPTLANGTGDTGDVYICNVAGTVNFGAGPLTFAVGDYVIYSGTIWQRSSGAVGTVTSVAASITGNSIGITGSPITTSGTLALAFAGTSAQYVNGAGNLITFPSIISEAQNLITEVYNKSGATITKGTVVYINGGQGNLPSIAKALATGDATSAQTYGIVQADITNMNNGYVVAAGRLGDLNTSAFTEGTQLYLSATTAGTYTSTKQYAPNHLVYIAIVVRAHPTQGVIEVKIQNGYEMDELHNVAAQSPSNGDILQYVTSTSLWTKTAGTTTNIAEGTNLYYTEARVNANTNVAANTAARHNAVTIGTANGLSLSTQVLSLALASGSTTGALSSTDWTTFNSKQNALTNPVTGTGASGQVTYFNGTSTVTGTNNHFWDATNNRLGIGTTTPQRSIEIFNSTADNHLRLSGNAPSVSMGEAVTGSIYQAKFGLVTVNGQFVTAGVAGDFVIISQTGATIIGTSSTEKMRVQSSGNVSINNTNDTYKLDVTGTGRFTGQLRLESTITDGTYTYTLPSATGTLALTSALSGMITGSGTTNYLPKFTGTSTIGNSSISDNGTGRVSIGTTSFNDSFVISNSGAAGWEFSNSGSVITYNRSTSAYIPMTFQASSFGFTGAATFSSKVGIGATPYASTTAIIRAVSATSTNYALIIEDNASNQLFEIKNNGAATFSSSVTATSGKFASANGTTYAATPQLRIDGNGVNNSYAQIVFTDSALSDGKISYFPAAAAENRYFSISPRQVESDFVIRGSNVGIGTTSPSSLLHVNSGTSGTQTIANFAAANYSSPSSRTYIQIGTQYGDGSSRIGSINTTGNQSALVFQTQSATSGVWNDAMYINGSGNVGIGTTSPTVIGANYRTLEVTSPTGGGYVIVSDNSGVKGEIAADGAVYVSSKSAHPMIFRTTDTERMRITSGGNVGIGTTSPTARLDLGNNVGSANTANQIALYSISGTALYGFGVSAAQLNYISGGNHSFYNSATTSVQMTITGAGNVGIGTTAPSSILHIVDTSANNTTLTIGEGGEVPTIKAGGSNTDLKIEAVGAGGYLQLVTNSNPRIHISAAGNVGIGTTSPGSKLSIVGLPTSSSGLTSGDIWNDSGTLKIV